MLIKDKTIAIIGGGPGGLTLARLLQLQGAQVRVYERDAHRNIRVQGATLDLHDNSGLKAFEAAGLMQAFKAHYRPGADLMRLVDNHANVLYDQHTEAYETTFGHKHFRPEIDRGPLREILLDSLQPGTVVWDSHFTTVEADGEGWKILFKNGRHAFADIVVACDGANSRIRPYVTPIKAFYSGYTAVEGTIYDAAQQAPRIDALLKGGKIFALANNQSIIVSSKGDGSLAFYPCFAAAEDWTTSCGIDWNKREQVAQWFRETYSAWDEVWQELFAGDQVAFIPRPLYCMPFDQDWKALSNLTLLGDAAHVMPPYAGEGVNMAMFDALELSESLCSKAFATVREAIAAYESNMRQRASAVAKMSLDATVALHSPGAMEYMRNIFSGA